MTVKLRSVATVLSITALFAVAGCGGADSTDHQQAAVAAPKVELPKLPDAAEKESTAGGIAFTKHYFAVVNYAFRTGRTEELAKLTAPTCEICRATIGDVVYAYQRGTIRGGDITIKEVQLPDQKGVITNQQMTYDVAKYEEIGSSGKVLHSVTPKQGSGLVVKLTWVDGGWRVGQLRRIARQ
ncbi:MAG: DUF6318 family protein [Dehalococcoidia bacterium]